MLIDSKTDSHDSTQLISMKFPGSISFIGLLMFPNNLEELLHVGVFSALLFDWMAAAFCCLECILSFYLKAPSN